MKVVLSVAFLGIVAVLCFVLLLSLSTNPPPFGLFALFVSGPGLVIVAAILAWSLGRSEQTARSAKEGNRWWDRLL